MSRPSLVVRNAEVSGRVVDVRIVEGRVDAVAERLGADVEHDADGGAVIPGLHDHHIHVLALAAAWASTSVEHVGDAASFDDAVRSAAAANLGRWLRVVGYHESMMGPLDRDRLDALAPSTPVRVQHATGAMWVFNTPALQTAGVDQLDAAGVERDGGRVTGRLYGLDDVLAERVPRVPPDVGAVGAHLAGLGITGVTDLTPTIDRSTADLLAQHTTADNFPVDVMITGGLDLPDDAAAELPRGPVKLLAADHALPTPDALATDITTAHRRSRPVAIHCASRTGLIVGLAALEEAGPRDGDRIEHGAAVPAELIARLRELGVVVVTQPSFVLDRGDRYLREVPGDEHADLWRCASLREAGVRVAAGSDAPYGDPDPWHSIAAAVDRRTRTGRPFGPRERIPARVALDMYLTSPKAPAGPLVASPRASPRACACWSARSPMRCACRVGLWCGLP